MKLFVFLGNIGRKYERSRHNAGFLLSEYLRKEWKFPEWKEDGRFFGAVCSGEYSGKKILFLRPHTMMNLSGKSLQAVQSFYKIPTSEILLCYDDKDLPFGTVRFREGGSSGGHNGVKDCLRVLGTQEVARIKIGVDAEERKIFTDTAAFVLANFTKEELEKLSEVFFEAKEKIVENF